MPESLKSNFEIFISKWIPQRKDVKNLELWILISWDGITFDNFDLTFSNVFYDGYVWTKFRFLCQNPFKLNLRRTEDLPEDNFYLWWNSRWRAFKIALFGIVPKLGVHAMPYLNICWMESIERVFWTLNFNIKWGIGRKM